MKRIVIVGSGVVGLSTAWYCRKKGFDVTVVDRLPREHENTSFGNAGYIAPSHFIPLAAPGMVAMGLRMMWNPESPFYIKPRLSWDLLSWAWLFWRAGTPDRVERAAPLLRDLNLRSRDCYEEFEAAWTNAGNGGFDMSRAGLLMVCKTEKTLDKEKHLAEAAWKLGLPAEIYDAAKLATVDPAMKIDALGGVLFPCDWFISPHKFMRLLQAKLEADSGCRFVWNAETSGVELRGRRVHAVKTSQGDVEGDEFVVAGGAWSPVLSRAVGLKLPMQAGKGYSLTMPKPKHRPPVSILCVEARVAVTPMGESLRFGGTMEIAGLNETITPARVRGIVKGACAYLPLFTPADFEGIPPWRGLRPVSPDGLPYIGRTRRAENLSINAGHAMMGLSLGPISGKLMSEVLAGETPSLDLALLDPDRYG